MHVATSNGKSSIVEERLYSLFSKKNEASFFRFSFFTQLGTKTFVLLRYCKIFKRFTSLCFVFPNFWDIPIRFTFDFEKLGLIPFPSLCSSKILEQPGRFFFDLQKFRNKQFVLLSILLYFGLKFVFASILTSYGLILIVSLRFLTFSRTKLRFRFDFDKLKANIVRFASLQRLWEWFRGRK